MLRNRVGSISRVVSPVLLMLAASCGGGEGTRALGPDPLDLLKAGIPDGRPHINGSITLVQSGDSVQRSGGSGNPNGSVSCPPDCAPSGSPMRSVLIEEAPGGHGDDKSHVRVPHTAVLLRKSQAGVERIGFSDLQVGQKVSAWFIGPVAESYPTQATARVIVLEP